MARYEVFAGGIEGGYLLDVQSDCLTTSRLAWSFRFSR